MLELVRSGVFTVMGGSRIFDWGGPRIEEARDAGQNMAIFALKSWPMHYDSKWLKSGENYENDERDVVKSMILLII